MSLIGKVFLFTSLGRWLTHVVFPKAHSKRLKQKADALTVSQAALRKWKHCIRSCSCVNKHSTSLWNPQHTYVLNQFAAFLIWYSHWAILWGLAGLSSKMYILFHGKKKVVQVWNELVNYDIWVNCPFKIRDVWEAKGRVWEGKGKVERWRRQTEPSVQNNLPILLVEFQHHVVSSNTEWASALVVLLLALWLVHIGRGHGAVVGVVVGVDRAAVAACQVELNI